MELLEICLFKNPISETKIKILNLSKNPIQKEGAKILANVLVENTTIRTLDLSSCELGTLGT